MHSCDRRSDCVLEELNFNLMYIIDKCCHTCCGQLTHNQCHLLRRELDVTGHHLVNFTQLQPSTVELKLAVSRVDLQEFA